eukprot:m.339294 g.339294  ORF g.339294 m.339294 type:complete len:357 (+) comp16094_c1_seq6:918-1988(+)
MARKAVQAATYSSCFIVVPVREAIRGKTGLFAMTGALDTVITWDAQRQIFLHGDHLVDTVQSGTLPKTAMPWLRMGVMSCGKECTLYADQPATLPSRGKVASMGTVVGVAYGSTPMLPYYLDYYKRTFGIVHHTIYYVDDWEYRPGGEKPLPGIETNEYNLTLIPWNFKLPGYYFANALSHMDAVYRHRGAFDVLLNLDLDELLVWNSDEDALSFLTKRMKRAADPVACFRFVRFYARRDCQNGGQSLTAQTIQAEDMMRVRMQMSNYKTLYYPLGTRESSPHECFPLDGYKISTMASESFWVAHVARNEPNATTCFEEEDEAIEHGAEGHIEKSNADSREYIERETERAQLRWAA